MPKTIIIAEDDEGVHETLDDFLKPKLKKQGFDVRMAHDGQEALRIFNELGVANVAAVITDGDMPHLNGVELTKAVRAQADNIPVIMVSANDGQIKAAMAAGANGSVKKPLGMEEIEEIVYRVTDAVAKSTPNADRLADRPKPEGPNVAA